MKASSVSVYCERGVSGSHISTPHPSFGHPLPQGARGKIAFTLAEVFLPHSAGCRRTAFTLAEVLITLGIIGVVAAITLPALITNIQDRVKEKRVQNIQQKFSKATDKMLATSELNGYDSTLDFVNELKNHLSIAKICENDELRNCWPTEKVIIDDDGTEWDISKTKTGKTLKMTNDDEHEWSDTVGLITGDGTAMILSYNTKCDIEPTATSNWTSDKSSSTNCIAAVFDWNGSSKPNMFGTERADVLALNANGLGISCAFNIDGRCFGSPFIPTPVTRAECDAMILEGKLSSCSDENDYWAGAVKQCGGATKMANMDDVAKIASRFYVGNPSIGANEDKSKIAYIAGSATNLGFSEPTFSIWTGIEYTGTISEQRQIRTNGSYRAGSSRTNAGYFAVCVLN